MWSAAPLARADEATPLTEPLVEEREMAIACELTQPPKRGEVPVYTSPADYEATKGLFHYYLWLPKGYLASGAKKWPCVFLMSPGGGKARMGNMADYLQGNGFVVVTLMEAENGPWPPIIGDFLASHDDVMKRVRVDPEQKYATGSSGGARGSSVFVQLRPGFCGLVLQAAGPSYDAQSHYNAAGLVKNARLRIAMTMGLKDKNREEAARTAAVLPKARFKLYEFDGGHGQAPPEIFAQAMDFVRGKTAGKSESGLTPLAPLNPLTPLKPMR